MIANLPTPEDFYTSGKELLNFAWDSTATLLMDVDRAVEYVHEDDLAEVSQQYWAASKRTLTTALTVIQQAVELVIKGRIAEVSPYLLISDGPSRWPSPYEGKPVDFDRFRTIDAQDLIRVHDTFAPEHLDANFVDKFRRLREIRNVVMHSAGKNVTVQVAEVVDSALFMHKSLFPLERWFPMRREFLRTAPSSALGAGEYATNNACWEASIVKKLLQPAQVRAYLGVEKKERAYYCPECLDDASSDIGLDYKLAVLRPDNRDGCDVYCPVCDNIYHAEKYEHRLKGCEATLYSGSSGRCLVCGRHHDDESDAED
ncbi:hypothetical protein [Paraburkholderia strydomiana]|uniref:hypothetical protein n=1 Tax=Paraburkholderia strydomiana TaxID=1245417 RepID=UPI0038BBA897